MLIQIIDQREKRISLPQPIVSGVYPTKTIHAFYSTRSFSLLALRKYCRKHTYNSYLKKDIGNEA